MSNPYLKQTEQYKRNQIETATPAEILIILYDGAIRFLVIAKKAQLENQIEKSHKNLLKAQQIIREFMNSLDMEIGGEMAVNLYRLYEYFHFRLVQANIKKDTTMIDEVLEHLRSLKATWEEAMRIVQKTKRVDLTQSANLNSSGTGIDAGWSDDGANNALRA